MNKQNNILRALVHGLKMPSVTRPLKRAQELVEFIVIAVFFLSSFYHQGSRSSLAGVQSVSEILFFTIFTIVSISHIFSKFIFHRPIKSASQDTINLLRAGGITYIIGFLFMISIPMLVETKTDPQSQPFIVILLFISFLTFMLPYFKLVNILDNPKFHHILAGYALIIAIVLDFVYENRFITSLGFAASFALSYYFGHPKSVELMRGVKKLRR